MREIACRNYVVGPDFRSSAGRAEDCTRRGYSDGQPVRGIGVEQY